MRDSGGIYSLPEGYRAVTGEPIEPSQHNAPLEDIAEALTNSLPRNGAAAMTDQLRLVDGSESRPALGFNSLTGLGLFKTPNGLAIAVGGMKVAEFTSGDFVATALGAPVFLMDEDLPPNCIWAGGQNISRSTYSRLFAKWGTKHGAGDGSTTFGVPDWRGCAVMGSDKNGGPDANQLASVPVVSGDRFTPGSVLGANRHTLTLAEMASHTHNVIGSGTVYDLYPIGGVITFSDVPGWQNMPINVMTTYTSTPNSFTISGTAQANGGGGAHNNVARSLVCNVAIYAGA